MRKGNPDMSGAELALSFPARTNSSGVAGAYPEAQLFERAKRRSPSAWADLYGRYYEKLYLYCYAHTFDQNTAAVLASHVFLKAVDVIDQQKEENRSFFVLFYRAAREVIEQEHPHAANNGSTPHSEGASDEGASSLASALNRLPFAEREVIALRHYAGCTAEEVASSLDETPKAVFRIEARALAHLSGTDITSSGNGFSLGPLEEIPPP